MTVLSRAFVLFLVTGLIAGLAACYPTTRNPIGISGGTVEDSRLEGAWLGFIGETDDGPAYLFFFRRDDGMLEAMLTRPAIGEEDGGCASVTLGLGRLGEDRLMNARTVLDDGDPPDPGDTDYTALAYRFAADGSLHLFMPSERSIEDAIRSGGIAGEISQNRFFNQATLTADSEALDAFFEGAMHLFDVELGVFRPLH